MASDVLLVSSLKSLTKKLRELQSNACKWSLADDRQLCILLNEVNDTLRTELREIMMKSENNEIAMTGLFVQIANLNNRLSSFAAHQFVENRIGEDMPSPQPISPAVVESTANKREEAIENLRSAAASGLKLVQTHFRRINMRAEDFDEVDDPTFTPGPVFEPLDDNLARALPYVIGTLEWSSSHSAGTSDHPTEKTRSSVNVMEEVAVTSPPADRSPLPSVISTCSTTFLKNDEDSASRVSSPVIREDKNKQVANLESTSNAVTQLTDEKHFSVDSKDVEKRAAVKYNINSSPVNNKVDRKTVVNDLEKLFSKSTGRQSRSLNQTTESVIPSARFQYSADVSVTGSVSLFDDSSDDDALLFEENEQSMRPPILNSTNRADELGLPKKEAEDSETAKNSVKIVSPKSDTKTSITKARPVILISPTDVASEPQFTEGKHGYSEHLEKNLARSVVNADLDGETEILPSLSKHRAKGPPRRLPTRKLVSNHENDKQATEAHVTLTGTSPSSENMGEKLSPLPPESVNATTVLPSEAQVAVSSVTPNSAYADWQNTASDRKSHAVIERESNDLPNEISKGTDKTKSKSHAVSDEYNIFSSSSDDDIFSSHSKLVRSQKEKSMQKRIAYSGSKFPNASMQKSSSMNVERVITVKIAEDRIGTDKELPAVKNLFDSDSEDDLFTSKKDSSSIHSEKTDSTWKEKYSVAATDKFSHAGKRASTRIDIFGDDDSDDLFQ